MPAKTIRAAFLPVLFILGCCVCIWVIGLIGAIPLLGDIIAGVFFVLALAFYFYGTLSYLATEESVHRSIQFGRILSSRGVFKIELTATLLLLLVAWAV